MKKHKVNVYNEVELQLDDLHNNIKLITNKNSGYSLHEKGSMLEIKGLDEISPLDSILKY